MLLRLRKKPQTKYQYALNTDETRIVQMLGLLGLVSVALLAVGFILFAKQSLLIALITIPTFIITILYHAIDDFLMLMYPGFDVSAHRKKVSAYKKETKKYPRIAVLIPAAGEDSAVVKRTAQNALKMTYPNFAVYILDDSKDALYKPLAKQLKAKYFRRKNIGEAKKAGNLNAAIKTLKGFDHCLVLDADFVPRKEMLIELVAYTAEDVGIIQSPQHFDLDRKVFKRSKIEFGAGHIQKDFYRITMVARDRFDAAICVGTNALYNLTAIRQVGGFEGVGRKEWAHSEDVNTGLNVINSTNTNGERYRITYVPVQLAKGICPPNQLSFYKQQNRWATGSMQLMFSGKTLFSDQLSFLQKVAYVSNPLYYLFTISTLLLPLQLLVLLLGGGQASWMSTLLFVPMLITSYALKPFLLRKQFQPVAIGIVTLSNAYTFAQALYLLIIKRPLGWEATGASGSKSKSTHFNWFKIFSSFYFVTIYLATFAVLVINNRIGLNATTFIVTTFTVGFFSNLIFLYYTLLSTVSVKSLHLESQFYSFVLIVALTLGVGIAAQHNSSTYDVVASKNIVGFTIAKPKVVPAMIHQQKDSIKAPAYTDITVSITGGNSQFEIAKSITHTIESTTPLSLPRAGKVHDMLVRQMGYEDSVPDGASYTFTAAQIEAIVSNSYPAPFEVGFWTEYALENNI